MEQEYIDELLQKYKRYRNLVQYKSMTDEEFAVKMQTLEETDFDYILTSLSETFEERAQKKMEEFEKDYDLSDMKYNDKETLKVFCRALVELEDYSQILNKLRGSSLEEFVDNLQIIEKISKVSDNLRNGVGRLQDVLKISRKIRKTTKEESARAELDRLKEKASRFLKSVSQYIYCEECGMLLSTAWFLYPEGDNEISLKCNREYRDDEGNIVGKCDHVTRITSQKLLSLKGTNHPEGFKY